jgi:hypothetical protein
MGEMAAAAAGILMTIRQIVSKAVVFLKDSRLLTQKSGCS